MEGKGAYNRYAKLPASAGALALPELEKAAMKVAVDTAERPVVVADYGSSQGKNSLAPVRTAIRALRSRIGAQRPIFVFHIDQPRNDFNTLFEVLALDPDSYAREEQNVYPCAIGRSFYESVLPAESVHLGWCSYAAVWLSRIPARIPGHFIPVRASDAVRHEFERQAARDWKNFVTLRGRELARGGRLVVVLPARADDGLTGFESIMDHANEVLSDMVREGAITTEERGEMTIGAYPRQKSELLAPFGEHGEFQGLRVESLEVSSLRDAAWEQFERDADREGLAAKHALFFRPVFMPTLAGALPRVRAGEEGALGSFGDRLERGLKERVARQPAPMHSLVQTIVLAKA